MSDSSSTDSFLQKTTDELHYLVQNPGFYDPSVVAEAGRELRRRGALLPVSAPAPPPEPVPYPEAPVADSRLPSWWPALLLGLAVIGLGWWGWRASGATPAPAAATVRKAPAGPIVLEAVRTRQLPTFEQEAATQVAQTCRLLPAADRADTTATGRYARMARRYWLAENTAHYLTAQALGDSATGVFADQAGIALERVSWFMKAKAYDQHLTAEMESRLLLMQRGLELRRTMLQTLRSRAEAQFELADANLRRDQQEAVSISQEVLGRYGKGRAIQGKISDL